MTMRITVRLLNPIRQAVGESEVEVDFAGGSVDALVKAAGKENPKLGEAILTEDGNIDYSINVILNGRPLTESAMQEELKDGDEVTLLTAVAGG
jgi:MoaD family protein